MKIVIIGGTGLIGSKLVKQLTARGHQAVPAAPNTGVNTVTGEGLAEVMAGTDVVVDVSNSPSFEDAAVLNFFETSTRNQLAAEAAAGVGHHVALSIVGVERPSEGGYFRAKAAQEKSIRESSIPYSIVHATQFFEFVGRIADSMTEGNTVRVAPVLFQPVSSDDVVAKLCEVTLGSPLYGIVEVAGPEQFRFDELIRLALSARGDPREVVTDPNARYFGATMEERTLMPGNGASVGSVRFEDWLARTAERPASAQSSSSSSAIAADARTASRSSITQSSTGTGGDSQPSVP